MTTREPCAPSHRLFELPRWSAARALMLAAALSVIGWGRGAAAGYLDESFGDIAVARVDQAATQIFALAVQPDGKVIVGGYFDLVGGQPRREIARLLADGTLDPSFTSPFEATGLGVQVQTLALDANGGIFAGGAFELQGALKTIVKLEPDGSVDSTFTADPALALVEVAQLRAFGGKLYVAGAAPGSLDRLNADGSLDPTFSHFSDTRSPDFYLDFVLEPSGSLIVGLNEFIVGLSAGGTLVSSFAPVPAVVPKLGLLSGGDLLFYSNFAEINATAPDKRFTRLKPNGTVTASFTVDPQVRLFVGIEADDKILIEQQLSTGEALLRLASDGTPDDFVVPIDDIIRATASYPDHRLMIAGMFGKVEHTQRTHIARLFESNAAVGASGAGGDGDGGDGGDGAAGAAPSGSAGAGVSGSSSGGGSAAAGAGGGPSASGGGSSAVAGSGGAAPAGSSGSGCGVSRDARRSHGSAWWTIAALALLTASRRRATVRRIARG